MPKTLLYYISVGGDKYYRQTRTAIRSLREFGRYTGDVAVITDQPMLFGDTRTIDFAQIMPQRPEAASPATFIMNAKPMILRAVPRVIGYHDFSMYLDSDTLVVSPRFRSLIDGMARIGGLWVQQNYWSNMAHCKQVNQGGHLDPATFTLCQNLSVCAGMVGFGSDVYTSLEMWKSLVEKSDFSYDDQALLHVVCAKYNDGRVHYIPQHDVWFPTNRIHSPSIYHFTHQGSDEQRELTSLLYPDA